MEVEVEVGGPVKLLVLQVGLTVHRRQAEIGRCAQTRWAVIGRIR